MKKILFVLILLAPSLCFAQGFRFDSQVSAEVLTTVVPNATNVLTIPSSVQVAFCNFPNNAVPCTNKATTYTSVTLATPCSTSTQIVLVGSSSCVASPDAQQNWGVWVAAGNYSYTLTLPGGVNLGPYVLTLGTTAGTATNATNLIGPGSITGAFGGNYTATGQVGITDLYNLTGAIVCDGVKYTTLNAAVAAASTPGIVIIPLGAVCPVTSNLSVPANVTLEFFSPSLVPISTAVTLTINGPVKAQDSQLFSYTGTGTVAFASALYPIKDIWFPGSDACQSMNNAIKALPNPSSGSGGAGGVIQGAFTGDQNCFSTQPFASITTPNVHIKLGNVCYSITPANAWQTPNVSGWWIEGIGRGGTGLSYCTGTQLQAAGSGWAGTPILRLGTGGSPIFGIRALNFTIDANGQAPSACLYSTDINEQSEIGWLTLANCITAGFDVESLSAGFAQHYWVHDLEIYSGAGSLAGTLPMKVYGQSPSNCAGAAQRYGPNLVQNITIAQGGATKPTVGIQADGLQSTVFENIHVEASTDGIKVGNTNCSQELVFNNVSGLTSVTNTIHLVSTSGNGGFQIFNVTKGLGAVSILDDIQGKSITDQFVGYYQVNGTTIFSTARDYFNGPNAFTGVQNFSGNTVALTADWTCGTGGTVASCAAATIIGSGGGVPLTFTLPLIAQSYTLECDGVVGQATAATANQWNLLTATNGATNVTANYSMATAATAYAAGAVTDTASTTTTFQIAPSWTLGAAATKMPFHIWAKIEGASASGTVVSVQLVAPTVGDLVTIYRGAVCRVF